MSDRSAKTFSRSQVAGALDDTAETSLHLKADGETGSLRVNLWVWDVINTQWVKMQQVTSESIQYLDERFDYTSGDLDYIGKHQTHDAAEGAATWHVWKLTYSGGNLTRKEGPLVGSWTGRAALDWGT